WAVPSETNGVSLHASSANPTIFLETGKALFRGFSADYLDRLVVTAPSNLPFVESFRNLAGTLHAAQRERNIKVVMITSAVPEDGKTLTAMNLALSMSESYGRQVLLIDAD